MTYRIFVHCTSFERFDVDAESPSQAIEKFNRGEGEQELDEVLDREISHVESSDGRIVWEMEALQATEMEGRE